MKIEIAGPEIEAIIAELSASATSILRKQVAKLEEEELIRAVREHFADPKQRVLAYLLSTQQRVHRSHEQEWVDVDNSYLCAQLQITVRDMKKIRDGLVAADAISILSRSRCTIVWRFQRRLNAAIL